MFVLSEAVLGGGGFDMDGGMGVWIIVSASILGGQECKVQIPAW